MMAEWNGLRWFIDTEGNGAKTSEIIEFGAVETFDLEPTGKTRRWLVRPSEAITWHATQVHGLTDQALAKCPMLHEVRPEILSVIKNFPIGGHAVHGELDALSRSLPGWRPLSAIDTLGLARSILPTLERHGLQSLVRDLNLDKKVRCLVGGKPHTALFDAMASALLARELRTIAGEKTFHHAFCQAESLNRWDRMVHKRVQKKIKADQDQVRRSEKQIGK